MNSQLLNLADYHTLPLKLFEKKIPKSQIDLKMKAEIMINRMQKRKILPGDEIAEESIVTLSLQSEAPYYNREQCELNVGLGLFSEELERKFIGHHKNEKFKLTVQDQNVEVTILDVKKVHIPAMKEEFIAAEHPLGANSMSEYKILLNQKIMKQYEDKYLRWYTEQFLNKWCAASTWNIDENEVNLMVEDFLPEENTDEELRDELWQDMLLSIKTDLICQKLYPENYLDSNEDISDNEVGPKDKLMTMLTEWVKPKFRIVIKEDE